MMKAGVGSLRVTILSVKTRSLNLSLQEELKVFHALYKRSVVTVFGTPRAVDRDCVGIFVAF